MGKAAKRFYQGEMVTVGIFQVQADFLAKEEASIPTSLLL
jgi:hypothetical protein